MSGGHFNYFHDKITQDIFGWNIDADYNLGAEEQKKGAVLARAMNPLNDVELSEMLYDLACVLKAHDWWRSGDCGVECYNNAKRYFKKKWFGKTQKQRIEAQVNKAVEQFRQDVGEMFENEE